MKPKCGGGGVSAGCTCARLKPAASVLLLLLSAAAAVEAEEPSVPLDLRPRSTQQDAARSLKAAPGEEAPSTCRRHLPSGTPSCTALPPNATCLGSPLPHPGTSFSLAGLQGRWEAEERLANWTVLRAVPLCWEKVQPLLCAVYFPRCDAKEQALHLVSRQLCRATRRPCRIAEEELGGWPEYLRCDNDEVFSDDGGPDGTCKKDKTSSDSSVDSGLDRRPFSNYSRGECVYPLLPTERDGGSFGAFDGCGMRCRAPSYTDQEYERARWISRSLGIGGLVVFSLALGTQAASAFIAPKRDGGKKKKARSGLGYDGRVLLHIYLCCLLACVGLSMQYFVEGDSLVCEEDGTRRMESGGAGGGSACQWDFGLLYFSFLAYLVFFVCRCYGWMVVARHEPSRAEETLSWFSSVGLFLAYVICSCATFILAAVGMVEANSLIGVCFVSSKTAWIRVAAVSLPAGAAVVLSACFFAPFLRRVFSGWAAAAEKRERRARLARDMVWTSAFVLANYVLLAYLVVYEVTALLNTDRYARSLMRHVICLAGRSSPGSSGFSPVDPEEDCPLSSRPTAAWAGWMLLWVAAAAIASLAWLWHSAPSPLGVWKAAMSKMCQKAAAAAAASAAASRKKEEHEDQDEEDEEDRRYRGKKHKIISQAYEQRNKLEDDGQLSISLPASDVEDASAFRAAATGLEGFGGSRDGDTSDGFGESFAAALPRLISRRGAVCGDDITQIQHVFPAAPTEEERVAARSAAGDAVSVASSTVSRAPSVLSIQPRELEELRRMYGDTLKGKRNNNGRRRSKRDFFSSGGTKANRKMKRLKRTLSNVSVSSLASSVSNSSSMMFPAITGVRGPPSLAASSSMSDVSVAGGFEGENGIELRVMRRLRPSSPNSESVARVRERLALANLSTDASAAAGDLIDGASALPPPLPLASRDKEITTVSVQTSFTDLSVVGGLNSPSPPLPPQKPSQVTVGTQYEEIEDSPDLKRSSQKKSSKQKQHLHLEPKIHVLNVASGPPSSSTSQTTDSSELTSAAKDSRRLLFSAAAVVPPFATAPLPPLPPIPAMDAYNQERRGGCDYGRRGMPLNIGSGPAPHSSSPYFAVPPLNSGVPPLVETSSTS